MFHQHQSFAEPQSDTPGLQRGDVVLFRFPLAEDDAERGAPKRRPCLVLDTLTESGERFVEIAYGTSMYTKANRGYEVICNHPSSRIAAGLTKPTRFVCARRIIVHVNHSGFHGATAGVEIIGHLDGPLTERMNAVRARLNALADAATQYRAEQAREDRGFR